MNPTLSGIFALLIFSTITVLITLSGAMPGLQLSAIVLMLSAILLGMCMKMRGCVFREAWRQPVSLYVIIISGIGLYTACISVAFKSAPPFEVNMLNYLWPLLLVLFSKMLKREPFKAHELIGLCCGAVGGCFIFMPADGQVFENLTVGHALAVFAAVIWAFYSSIIDGKNYSVAVLVPVLFISSLICWCAHLLIEDTVWALPLSVWVSVIILGVSHLSYVLWDYGMRQGDKMLLSSLSYFVPLVSTCYFIAFGFVPARVGVAIGGAFIVAGCVIVNIHHLKRLMKR